MSPGAFPDRSLARRAGSPGCRSLAASGGRVYARWNATRRRGTWGVSQGEGSHGRSPTHPRFDASTLDVSLVRRPRSAAGGRSCAAGCGASATPARDGGSTAAGAPKAGGSISIAFQSEPVTLDPAISWDVAGWTVEDSVFNALYRYAPKSGAAGTELIPDLAVGHAGISADGKTYTFNLRPDAKFQPPVNREVTPTTSSTASSA